MNDNVKSLESRKEDLIKELMVWETRKGIQVIRTEANARILAELLEKPYSWGFRGDVWKERDIVNYAFENNLLMNFEDCRFGWLKPDGEFLTCNHATHEKLLEIMMIDQKYIEEEGWCRVGMCAPDCLKPLTKMQIEKLADMGIQVDKREEYLKKKHKF